MIAASLSVDGSTTRERQQWLFDIRDGVGIDLSCEIVKLFCFIHFAADFHYAFEVIALRTAEDVGLYQSAILRRRGIALIHETVVVLDERENS
jgi:hypothetical protein